MNKVKKIDREFLRKRWALVEEGKEKYGVVTILHCAECKGEIHWYGSVLVPDTRIIHFHPTESIEKGQCLCTIWRIIPFREENANGK